jgi:hypothetical protein
MSRNAMPRQSLRKRIEARIASSKSDVFLPREFSDLSGEDQVLRALRQLVREKRLVRLGYGVYGRAIVSRLSGEAILVSDGGFIGAARQYNEGRTTQVPVNAVLRVKRRFSRKLRLGKMELQLER